MDTTILQLTHRIVDAIATHDGIPTACTVTIHNAGHVTIEGTPAQDATRELFAPLVAKANGRDTTTLTPRTYLVTLLGDTATVCLYPQSWGKEFVSPLASRTVPIEGMDDATLSGLLDWVAGYRYEASSVDAHPTGHATGPVDGLVPIAQYAAAHGRAVSSVRQLARTGGFRTARRMGRDWWVAADEPYPDRRRKTTADSRPVD